MAVTAKRLNDSKSGKTLNIGVVYQKMIKAKNSRRYQKKAVSANDKGADGKSERVLILDNIRSVINVGAIFRTADAIGISKIYLTGYTPEPVDRFGRIRGDFVRASLGADKNVEWESVGRAEKIIYRLKKLKFQIIAVEQASNSVDYKKIKVGKRMAIIIGNEVNGISKNILRAANIVAEIPMLGRKESLNVSVAAGIFLFRVFDR